jgi:hypothetical protein
LNNGTGTRVTERRPQSDIRGIEFESIAIFEAIGAQKQDRAKVSDGLRCPECLNVHEIAENRENLGSNICGVQGLNSVSTGFENLSGGRKSDKYPTK